jgi:ATPase subunit of ABC transporter with duplicated ATPase domains
LWIERSHIERQEGRKDMIQNGLPPFERGKGRSGEAPARKLLEVRNLETKFYTVNGVVNALNGISYSVDRGECLAIVGESGSGKTVLMISMRFASHPNDWQSRYSPKCDGHHAALDRFGGDFVAMTAKWSRKWHTSSCSFSWLMLPRCFS